MDADCVDKEISDVCATDGNGATFPLREIMLFNSNGSPRATYYINPSNPLTPIDTSSLNITAGKCKRRLYTQTYRLDWTLSAQAEPGTTGGSPVGYVDLIEGDQMVIKPGWVSYSWRFLPQSSLMAVVVEDGKAHILRHGVAVNQPQAFGESVDSDEIMTHQVELVAANGAFVEVRVIRPV